MRDDLTWTVVLVIGASIPGVAAYRTSQIDYVEPPAAGHDTLWRVDVTNPDSGHAAGHVMDMAVMSDGSVLAFSGNGRVWRTSDDGRAWQQESFVGTTAVFRADGVGLLATPTGRIQRTADHGHTWTTVASDPQVTLRRLRFTGPNMAVAIGSGSVMRSEDDGRSWRSVDVPLFNYYGLARFGRITLIVGGSGRVLRSSDGGVTWSHRLLDFTNTLRAVAFADSVTALIVGSGGLILRSSDAGVTWTRVTSGTNMHLRSVAFRNATDGLAVGLYGTLLVTHDGGRTWSLEETGTRVHLEAATYSVTPLAAGWFDTILRRRPDAAGTRNSTPAAQ